MEQKRSSARTGFSFMVSMFLHSSAIALIALGPTFIPGLNGLGDRKSNNETATVEFSVADATTSEVTPTIVAPVQEVKLPEPAQVAEVIKPAAIVTPVVAKTAVKKVKKAKVESTEALPEKIETVAETIEPQPIVPAENTESPVDEVADQDKQLEEQKLADEAAAAEIEQQRLTEENLAQEKLEQERIEQEKFAEQQKQAEQMLAQKQAEEAAAQAAAAQAAADAEKAAQAQNAKGTGEEQINSQSNGGKEVIEVTQNYLGLRQQPGNQPPKYTREMRLQQKQGRGQLVYFVTKEGRVSDVKVLKSTGSAELDQSAVQAFSKYKFVPGQEGYTLHEFEFSLKGPAESDAGRLRTTYNR